MTAGTSAYQPGPGMWSTRSLPASSQEGQRGRGEGRGAAGKGRSRRVAKGFTRTFFSAPPPALRPSLISSSQPRKMGLRLCGRGGLRGDISTDAAAWPCRVSGAFERPLVNSWCRASGGSREELGRGQGETGLPSVPRNQSSQPWAFSSLHTEALLLAR